MPDLDVLSNKKETPPGPGAEFLQPQSQAGQEQELERGVEAHFFGQRGDFFSGLVFTDAEGRPNWGTRGADGALPAGVREDEVERFEIPERLLQGLKARIFDLPAEQIEKLTHLVGWRRKGSTVPEALHAPEQTPLVEPVVGEIEPDQGIAYSPQPTPEQPTVQAPSPENLSALALARTKGGVTVEALMQRIKSAGVGDIAAESAAAAQMHTATRSG